jgi:hypothetical protein
MLPIRQNDTAVECRCVAEVVASGEDKHTEPDVPAWHVLVEISIGDRYEPT